MRLITFDVDGTLVDSQDSIVEAQTRALTLHGYRPPSRQKALSVVGLSLTEAFAQLAGSGAPLEALATAYKQAWADLRLDTSHTDKLYPGAAAAVAHLSHLPGTLLGIATGKSRAGVDRILAAQIWSGLFATIQTSDEHPSKPHPSMMLRALAETGISANAAVLIGDTTYDMEMAAAAGVRAVGVAWGYHRVEALLTSGASAIVDDFDALLAVLDAHEETT